MLELQSCGVCDLAFGVRLHWARYVGLLLPVKLVHKKQFRNLREENTSHGLTVQART